jgi:hypothetical protein
MQDRQNYENSENQSVIKGSSSNYATLNILYFSILLHSFNTEHHIGEKLA